MNARASRRPVVHLPVGGEDAVVSIRHALVVERGDARAAPCPRGTRATRRRRWRRGSRCDSSPACGDRRGGVAAADDRRRAAPRRVGHARARRRACRRRTAASRTRPSGRSRAPSSPPRIARAVRARRSRARCRTSPGRPGSRSRATVVACAAGSSSRRDDGVDREHELVARLREQRRCAMSTRSGSTSDLPVSRPIARKNVYAIAPPMSRRSTLGSSASMTSILPEILEPPRIATNGRFGSASARAEVLELLLHQEAGDRRACRWRATPSVRRVRAVRRAERVVHVDVAERGEVRARARSSFFSSPARKRVFSSSSDLAVAAGAAWPRAAASVVGRARRSRPAAPQQLAEPRARPARASTSARARPWAGRGATAARRARRARAGSAIVGSAAAMRVSSVTRRRRRAAR